MRYGRRAGMRLKRPFAQPLKGGILRKIVLKGVH